MTAPAHDPEREALVKRWEEALADLARLDELHRDNDHPAVRRAVDAEVNAYNAIGRYDARQEARRD